MRFFKQVKYEKSPSRTRVQNSKKPQFSSFNSHSPNTIGILIEISKAIKPMRLENFCEPTIVFVYYEVIKL